VKNRVASAATIVAIVFFFSAASAQERAGPGESHSHVTVPAWIFVTNIILPNADSSKYQIISNGMSTPHCVTSHSETFDGSAAKRL